jgi:hypothetical protein
MGQATGVVFPSCIIRRILTDDLCLLIGANGSWRLSGKLFGLIDILPMIHSSRKLNTELEQTPTLPGFPRVSLLESTSFESSSSPSTTPEHLLRYEDVARYRHHLRSLILTITPSVLHKLCPDQRYEWGEQAAIADGKDPRRGQGDGPRIYCQREAFLGQWTSVHSGLH